VISWLYWSHNRRNATSCPKDSGSLVRRLLWSRNRHNALSCPRDSGSVVSWLFWSANFPQCDKLPNGLRQRR